MEYQGMQAGRTRGHKTRRTGNPWAGLPLIVCDLLLGQDVPKLRYLGGNTGYIRRILPGLDVSVGDDLMEFASRDGISWLGIEIMEWANGAGEEIDFSPVLFVLDDGEIRWLKATLDPETPKGGKRSEWRLFFTDVTELVDTRLSTRAEFEGMRQFLDQIPYAVIETTIDWTILTANRAAHRLLGHKPGTLVGKSIPDFLFGVISEERLDGFLTSLSRDAGRNRHRLEGVGRREDGTEFRFRSDWMRQRFANGSIAGYIGTLERVGEIAEVGAWQASSERLEESQFLAGDHLWWTDSEHRYDRFVDLFGRSPLSHDPLIGQRRWEIRESTPLDGSAWSDHIADLDANRPIKNFEYSYFDEETGHRVAQRLNGEPRFDAHGKFTGYYGISSDITAEVEARSAKDKVQKLLLASMDATQDGIAIFDENDRLQFWNKSYEQRINHSFFQIRFGMTHEEIIRGIVMHGGYRLSKEDHEAWIEKRLEAHRKTFEPQVQYVFDGRCMFVRDIPMPDGATLVHTIDLTEQLRIEEEYRLGHLIIEASPDRIAFLDPEFRYQRVNAAAIRAIGRSLEEIEGRHVSEVHGREVFDNILRFPLEMAYGGTTQSFEAWMPDGRGEQRYVQGDLHPVMARGEITGIVLMMRDITEKIQFERRLQTVMESMNEGVLAFGRDGSSLFMNRVAKELFRSIGALEEGELRPDKFYRHIVDLEGKPNPFFVKKLIMSVFDGGEVSGARYGIQLREGNGQQTTRWISTNITPLKDGNGEVIGAVKSVHDITDEQRTRMQLDLFRAVVEASGEAIGISDREGRVVYRNPAFVRLFGRPPDIDMTRLDMYPSDTADMVERFVVPTIELRGTWEGIVEAIDVSGRRFPLWERAGAIRDERGKVTHTFGVMHDYTREKRRQDALRSALEDAESANMAKSRFLAAASHDLRQPIAAMALLARALSRSKDMEEREVLTDALRDSIDQLQKMFGTLMDITALNMAAVKPDMTVFDISGLIKRLEVEFGALTRSKGGFLRVVKRSIPIRSDALLLERVLRNLLTNAVTHAPGSSVLLGVRRWKDFAAIEIYDTGPGIPHDKIPRIFDEFYRGDKSGRAESSGLGLGLSIVRQTVRLLNHDIEVKSRPGRGTMFRIRVPLMAGQQGISRLEGPRPD